MAIRWYDNFIRIRWYGKYIYFLKIKLLGNSIKRNNKYYVSKEPTYVANVQVQPEITKWLVQPGWVYIGGLPMLFQMRYYWPKNIGRSIGKYRMEYRKLIVLFLNRNFLILPDTRIRPYRTDTLYRIRFGTHFEVWMVHRLARPHG